MLVAINAQKLFVSRDYRNAGVSRYIGGIARHLPHVAGDERFVLYTNQHLRRWPEVEGPRLAVAPAHLPTSHPVLRIVWEQTALAARARRDGAAVLHCPLNVRPLAPSPPVVLTVHDLTFVRYPERFDRLRRRYLAILTRYSARRAARVLADSAATADDLTRVLGVDPARIDVVYPGVDDDFRVYEPASAGDAAALAAFRARHGLPEPFVLYLGTLEPRKNVDRLVAAFAILVRQGFRHALVLAGGRGWGYDAIFRSIEAHGVRERVLLPGYVAREEQALWYNAAQLFVYPSQYEGFGLPPLEAMACGVPVVTSNTSSLPEVVGPAGVTVDPDDVEGLAAAMVRVLTDSDLAHHLAAAGRTRAARFTWAAAAEECVAAYRRAGQRTAASAIGREAQ